MACVLRLADCESITLGVAQLWLLPIRLEWVTSLPALLEEDSLERRETGKKRLSKEPCAGYGFKSLRTSGEIKTPSQHLGIQFGDELNKFDGHFWLAQVDKPQAF